MLDKVIILTGASDGIGRVIAEKLGEEKATVVLAARRTSILEEVAKKIIDAGGHALVVPTDLREPKQIAQLVTKTMESFSKVDVLLNVAGMGYYDWIEENTAEEISEQFTVNVVAMLDLIHHVVPIMKKQKSGHIINFASYASRIATPPLTIYSSTKYAIEGLSDAIRRELSPWNINVTRVHPTAVNTLFNEKARAHKGINYPYDKITGVTKEQVADKVIAAIYHPKIAVYVAKMQFFVDIGILINRFFPEIIDLVMKYKVKKLWKLDRQHDPQAI